MPPLLVPELAEVHLLLDNVSASAAKPVPDLSNEPPFNKEPDTDWIQQICAIRYPPDPADPQDEVLNAAKLIRARNRLNEAVLPASGASIAFSLLMSEPPPRKWRTRAVRLWCWLRKRQPRAPSERPANPGTG